MKQEDALRLLLEIHQRVERLEAVVAKYVTATKKNAGVRDVIRVDFNRVPDMSDTEVVQICRMMGHTGASRQMDRADLEALLFGEHMTANDPVQEIREKIFAFVDGNDRIMRSVMPCDLDCMSCDHDCVIACWVSNSDIVEQ